jgi:hypothetical protein
MLSPSLLAQSSGEDDDDKGERDKAREDHWGKRYVYVQIDLAHDVVVYYHQRFTPTTATIAIITQ